MTLLPLKQQGPVQEMGIELAGHNAMGVRPYTMTFSMGDAVAPGAILGRRVEFFNFATNSWEVVLRTKANGQGPDGLLTWTEVTVKAGSFVNAKTGEFRTRVYWNSVGQLSPVWIDQAGWVMTSHWRG